MRSTKYTKLDPVRGCWLWTGQLTHEGYGYLKINKKRVLAHRWVYQELFGEIPEGLICRHRCDVPACVNPQHLLLGTHQDNMDDKVRRGRARGGNYKLDLSEVIMIKRRLAAGEKKLPLSREYNVDRKTIRKIAAGETYKQIAA